MALTEAFKPNNLNPNMNHPLAVSAQCSNQLTPSTTSQVPEQMKNLQSSIDKLEGAVRGLWPRLSSVTRSGNCKEECNNLKDPEGLVPVATDLKEASRRVSTLADSIYEITSLVEL